MVKTCRTSIALHQCEFKRSIWDEPIWAVNRHKHEKSYTDFTVMELLEQELAEMHYEARVPDKTLFVGRTTFSTWSASIYNKIIKSLLYIFN